MVSGKRRGGWCTRRGRQKPGGPVRLVQAVLLIALTAAGISADENTPPATRYLQEAAQVLTRAAVLRPHEDITLHAEPPAALVRGTPEQTARPDRILFLAEEGEQGLIWDAAEALTVTLDLSALHHLGELAITFDNAPGFTVPGASVEASSDGESWSPVARLAPYRASDLVVTRTVNMAANDEYQFIRLRFTPMDSRLCIRHIAVEATDGTLMRLAEGLAGMARQDTPPTVGTVSQLAMMLRVRRATATRRDLQEEALNLMGRYCLAAAGISMQFQLPEQLVATIPLRTVLVFANNSPLPLTRGSVKLRLPPGWRAAPSRVDIEAAPGQSVESELYLYAEPGTTDLTLVTTGSYGEQPFFVNLTIPAEVLPAVSVELHEIRAKDGGNGGDWVFSLSSNVPAAVLLSLEVSLPEGWSAQWPETVHINSGEPEELTVHITGPEDLPPHPPAGLLLLRLGHATWHLPFDLAIPAAAD